MGGCILDLSMEELLAGRSINKLDLKPNPAQWAKLSVSLPVTMAHMGVAVFGNKVFISGGRNSTG